MTEYRVTWCIDVEANSPQEAAEVASKIMQRPAFPPIFFVEPSNVPLNFYDFDQVTTVEVL